MRRRILAPMLVGLALTEALQAQQQAPPRIGVGAAQRRLTLQEAMAEALQHNLDIEIEKTNAAAASTALRAADGFYDPVFRWQPTLESRKNPTPSILQAANGRLTERAHSENFYFRQRLPWRGSSVGVDFENSLQSTSNPFYSLSPFVFSRLAVTFTQPLMRDRLIDEGRTEIRIRRKQLDASDLDFESRVIDVVAQTEQAYWDLVAARQQVAVDSDSVELVKEQLAHNQRQIEAGSLASAEVAASQAELGRRRDAWFASIGAVTEAENALKLLLGGGREDALWNDEIVPTEESTLQPPEAEDVTAAIQAAVKLRPEVRRLMVQQDITEVQREAAADQVKPQVNLVASYGQTGLGGSLRNVDNPLAASIAPLYDRLNALSTKAGLPPLTPVGLGSTPGSLIGGYGATLSGLFGGSNQTVSVGVAFDLTVRNHSAREALAQTSVTERRLKLQRAQAEQVIAAQIRNALQALDTAKQRIAEAEASERASKEKLESETRLFQDGESTNFLVLTRQTEYSEARHRLRLAKLDYNKAVGRLEVAMGATLRMHRIENAGRP